MVVDTIRPTYQGNRRQKTYEEKQQEYLERLRLKQLYGPQPKTPQERALEQLQIRAFKEAASQPSPRAQLDEQQKFLQMLEGTPRPSQDSPGLNELAQALQQTQPRQTKTAEVKQIDPGKTLSALATLIPLLETVKDPATKGLIQQAITTGVGALQPKAPAPSPTPERDFLGAIQAKMDQATEEAERRKDTPGLLQARYADIWDQAWQGLGTMGEKSPLGGEFKNLIGARANEFRKGMVEALGKEAAYSPFGGMADFTPSNMVETKKEIPYEDPLAALVPGGLQVPKTGENFALGDLYQWLVSHRPQSQPWREGMTVGDIAHEATSDPRLLDAAVRIAMGATVAPRIISEVPSILSRLGETMRGEQFPSPRPGVSNWTNAIEKGGPMQPEGMGRMVPGYTPLPPRSPWPNPSPVQGVPRDLMPEMGGTAAPSIPGLPPELEFLLNQGGPKLPPVTPRSGPSDFSQFGQIPQQGGIPLSATPLEELGRIMKAAPTGGQAVTEAGGSPYHWVNANYGQLYDKIMGSITRGEESDWIQTLLGRVLKTPKKVEQFGSTLGLESPTTLEAIEAFLRAQ